MNKAELLTAMRLKTEAVELESGTVNVSEIGAADYIKLWTDPDNQTDGKVDVAKFTPALVAFSVVDGKGKRIFSDDEIPTIARSSQAIFMKLAEAARRVNGLAGDAVKNSEPSQEESSASASA